MSRAATMMAGGVWGGGVAARAVEVGGGASDAPGPAESVPAEADENDPLVAAAAAVAAAAKAEAAQAAQAAKPKRTRRKKPESTAAEESKPKPKRAPRTRK